MICAVYRSKNRPNTYLFLDKKDDFSVLPKELQQIFGKPELVMVLTDDKLGKMLPISRESLVQEILVNRYWLWIKQAEAILLEQHHQFLRQEQLNDQ